MFEPVIGLEIHLALKTRSKLFCGCSAEGFGLEPNVNTCPVCLGLPGSLPVTNEEAILKATRFSLALHCQVPERTQFHRKHYFYPDAPKNYQISQFDRPIGEGGWLELSSGRRIGITRCHVEEDAGRLVHPPYADHSLVDLNRAGAPLIEMVTEPDLRTADEAREFLESVRAIARALGVSDASPEQGKMRADVNVSVHRASEPYGTKVEVKNLNSFKSVGAAVDFETHRQTVLLEDGRSIAQETRGWNEGGQKTYLLRTKEGSADYRYMPDPDLPPLTLTEAFQATVRDAMPELPRAKRARYEALGVKPADAEQIAFDVDMARFFDEATRAYEGPSQVIANWLLGDISGVLHAQGLTLEGVPLQPVTLAAMVHLIDAETISGKIAKDLLPEIIAGEDPEALVNARGLRQVVDVSAVSELVDRVLADHPDIVASVGDNPKALNALLGRVMKESQGTAKPELVRRLLSERLALSSAD